MTVSYHGSFFKLLLRWKGSMWKDCWVEVLIFLGLYYTFSLLYRFGFNDYQKQHFEDVCVSINAQTKQVPLTFLLGFFVSTIVKRWWDQFEQLPWPDELVCLTNFVIPGGDHDALLKRRTIARYLNLATALCWRDISTPVHKRFYDVRQLVKVGLMTEGELELYEAAEIKPTRWFLPLKWCESIVEKDSEVRGTTSAVVQNYLMELRAFRKSLRKMYCFDWVCVPMVYTQVVTIATYGFFLLCVFGRQFLDPGKRIHEFEADFYVPFTTILQLIFYIGWYKVAEHLISPFGEDNDDLELSYLLDRNIRVSFALIEQVYAQEPPLEEDPLQGRCLDRLLHYSRLSELVSCATRPPVSHVRVDDRKLLEAAAVDDNQPLSEAEKKKLKLKVSKNKHIREF